MGWFDKLNPKNAFKGILNPVNNDTILGRMRKEGKQAAKNAKKAIQNQQRADATAAYEADVNAAVNANSKRAAFRTAARANVLGQAAARGRVTLGAGPASSGGAAASPGAPGAVNLANVLRNVRSFQGGMR